MKMPSMDTPQVVPLSSIRTKGSSEERLMISSRRLSRDVPIIIDTNPFDVYYTGSPVGVPFLWESEPGTPKIKSRPSRLLVVPPLTPPPSFQSSPVSAKSAAKKHSKNNLVISSALLLPKLNLKMAQSHKSPSRSTSSTPNRSSCSSPLSSGRMKQRGVSDSRRMSFDSRIEEDDECESPVSTLCFGRRSAAANGRSRGCLIKLLLGEFS